MELEEPGFKEYNLGNRGIHGSNKRGPEILLEERPAAALSRRRKQPLAKARPQYYGSDRGPMGSLVVRKNVRRLRRAHAMVDVARTKEFQNELLSDALNTARRLVEIRKNGGRASISQVCGEFKPRLAGKGMRSAFYAGYDILKYAVKCYKREGRHLGYLHKQWSEYTRAKRLDKKIARLQVQRLKNPYPV